MKTSIQGTLVNYWTVLHVLVSFVFISSLFYYSEAKSIVNSNTITTNNKKRLPYYTLPKFYGDPNTFGDDREFQENPYTGSQVRRRIGKDIKKRQDKPGGWWGRDTIDDNKDLDRYGENKRQDGKYPVGGWWGRRDTIDDDKDLHGYGGIKRQQKDKYKVGGWWGRRDTIGENA